MYKLFFFMEFSNFPPGLAALLDDDQSLRECGISSGRMSHLGPNFTDL